MNSKSSSNFPNVNEFSLGHFLSYVTYRPKYLERDRDRNERDG